MDETMRALADPTRREILRALRAGDLSAGDIAARFDMTAPSISHHLNVLKEAGLVQAAAGQAGDQPRAVAQGL